MLTRNIFSILFAVSFSACNSDLVRTDFQINHRSFGNQAGVVLGFQEVIDPDALGLQPGGTLEGKTLYDIVSSRVSGRDDGRLCSECHNQGRALGDYWVPSERNSILDALDANTEYAGKAWGGSEGWTEGFIANPTKPDSLKRAFRAWKEAQYRD